MKRKKSLDNNQGWALLFCTPNILFFIVFFVIPAVVGFYYSLTNYNGLKRMDFVGLQNYITLFKDKEFYMVLLNTIKYALIIVPLNYFASMLLALFLNDESIKGNTITRILIYWPTLLSTIMVGLTWKWIFGESFGVVNFLLLEMGLPAIKWSSAAGPAFWTTIVASIWAGCGTNMLIFIGGLKQIPESLHEAALIDGANKWQDFWNVTFPGLGPVSFMVIMTATINAFKEFAMVQTLTNGGPGTATTYMIQYIYSTGFEKMKVGYSSAVSMVMFVILLCISLAQNKINSKRN